ncbi:L-histidine N(alpha)-methyltransferase [Streptomyces morookaense]|uniref:L-histidine N(Alpha)-methyltransferase n=1 Tax=Streptomyces morookaense TaxID=1970 RepID=A0A7Y7BAI3_STRMO|nr:L-histidine N(alpha)-methyltransferase [Streptomyces morookaense]NVK82042.1 L-histidine N(alpha)-methyltransferase [Streptomyces morookaense]GHF34159.1 dimethylhistidine N-methyltransferase [Streptomyces morookaense]
MSPEAAGAGAVEVALGPDRSSAGGDDELRAGLAENPRRIPHRYGYDAEGSRLFEEISRLPAYYPPRAERKLLREHGRDMVRLSAATELVDLGAGSAEKSEILLAAMDAGGLLRAYTGIDVSVQPMREAARRLGARWPTARITLVHGDFATALPWLRGRGTGRLMAMLGSTFGCLTPPERSSFLRALRACCGPHDHILLCADLFEPVDTVRRAYRAGCTGERPVRRLFALNTLAHLNREYGADFDLAHFEPDVVYDVPLRQVRGEIRSTRKQQVTIQRLGTTLDFAEDETFFHDVLHKFELNELVSELETFGFRCRQHWVEEEFQYAALLLD